MAWRMLTSPLVYSGIVAVAFLFWFATSTVILRTLEI
jgi:hypothetical protein